MGSRLEDDIRAILADDIQAKLPASEISDDLALLDEEVLDSMGIFQLVEILEDRFDLEIEDEELTRENFETVTAIAALVRPKLPA